jgi:hypothetical protein
MDTVIQNSVLDVQLSMEESLETVLKARGKPAGTVLRVGICASAVIFTSLSLLSLIFSLIVRSW